MDQTVCMDHFYGSGKGGCLLPVSAAHAAELKNKTGTKPLPAGHETVFHGFKQWLLGLGMTFPVKPAKIILDIVFVLRPAIITAHPGIPPPQGCRQEMP